VYQVPEQKSARQVFNPTFIVGDNGAETGGCLKERFGFFYFPDSGFTQIADIPLLEQRHVIN
jgi:hypothetical protein